jgi:hypothetical protein
MIITMATGININIAIAYNKTKFTQMTRFGLIPPQERNLIFQ